MKTSIVQAPAPLASTPCYPANRPPLRGEPLLKLPLGSIRPGGWLATQLALMATGMTGRLREASSFLADTNGWLGGEGDGWEEQAYWLRGFYPLAALSGDAGLAREAERWVEAVLGSQDDDGYFGPACLKRVTGKSGRVMTDLWPHMVMVEALRSHYEWKGDARVPAMLSRFFGFCRDLPDSMFMPQLSPGEDFGNWRAFVQYDRAADMLPSIYWLYNMTGDDWLLGLARRFYSRIAVPADEWLDRHVVNFTQRFRYPGSLYPLSGDPWHLEASEYWYRQHLATWGQQPGGIFAADELLRPGQTDPRQGFETCAMVEFLKSFSILGRITGDGPCADRAEAVMLNHFPASHTPDLKALHYLTASNQPQLDASTSHEYNNKGRMISYSPSDYRCCQHNAGLGWPLYAEGLWQATSDRGLAAWLYASCTVEARAGARSASIRLRCETDYPFDGRVTIRIEDGKAGSFPLYLRVPGWCSSCSCSVNGESAAAEPAAGRYIRIERQFLPGDEIVLDMQMDTIAKRWSRTGAASIFRGPLGFSARIAERWSRCGGSDAWPEWEVLPESPWNYALPLEELPRASAWPVTRRPVAGQPWTVENAPVEIRALGHRVPGWRLVNATADELRVGPIRPDSPREPIVLIPLGCARLRISSFPVASNETTAPGWEEAPRQCRPRS